MDAAWTRWVPAGEPGAQRGRTPMPPGDLVEVIVTAALPGGNA